MGGLSVRSGTALSARGDRVDGRLGRDEVATWNGGGGVASPGGVLTCLGIYLFVSLPVGFLCRTHISIRGSNRHLSLVHGCMYVLLILLKYL